MTAVLSVYPEDAQARIEQLEQENADLRNELVAQGQRIDAIEQLLLNGGTPPARPKSAVGRNRVGAWNVKMAYPDRFFDDLAHPGIGFPQNKLPLAQKMQVGTKVFIYLTSPVKVIVGLGEVSSPMKTVLGDRWPYQFDVSWVVGPCFPGVAFKDVNVLIRPRPGDTNFEILDQDAQNIIDQLKKQDPLTLSMVHKLFRQKNNRLLK